MRGAFVWKTSDGEAGRVELVARQIVRGPMWGAAFRRHVEGPARVNGFQGGRGWGKDIAASG